MFGVFLAMRHNMTQVNNALTERKALIRPQIEFSPWPSRGTIVEMELEKPRRVDFPFDRSLFLFFLLFLWICRGFELFFVFRSSLLLFAHNNHIKLKIFLSRCLLTRHRLESVLIALSPLLFPSLLFPSSPSQSLSFLSALSCSLLL